MRLIILLLLPFISCKNPSEHVASVTDEAAQAIIDRSIQSHGGPAYDTLQVSYTFRDKDYGIRLNNGLYQYTRSYQDSTGVVRDTLTNEGFVRYFDGKKLELSDRLYRRHNNSLNSISYFTLLPYLLNDPAVNKTSMPSISINNETYDVIKVTFQEEGGGEDFEDEYRYWINKSTGLVDYLAYSFLVNRGGVRFREAIDRTQFAGITFQNYINYKAEDKNTPLDSLPFMLENGELEELSRIENLDYR